MAAADTNNMAAHTDPRLSLSLAAIHAYEAWNMTSRLFCCPLGRTPSPI